MESVHGQDYDYLFKIVIVGNSDVGKSCLLIRYTQGKFHSTITTVGVDFKIRTIHLNGKTIKLYIWDTAGSERFRAITSSYYRGADGIILVYDVTNQNSFDSIPIWLSSIQRTAADDIPTVLVGNKCDLEESRVITSDRGLEYAFVEKIGFIETSAKTADHVPEAFMSLAKKILERRGITKKLEEYHDTVNLSKSVSVINDSSAGYCCSGS